MKPFLLILFILVIPMTGYSKENLSYTLNSDYSSINFSTIKLQYIIENGRFDNLSGKLDTNGKLEVSIPINNIETGILIRNERLSEILFQASETPLIYITGNLETNFQGVKSQRVKFTITYANIKVPLSMDTIVFNTGNEILITSINDIIINLNDLGIPIDRLNQLADTVGGINISSAVPVGFTLILNKV